MNILKNIDEFNEIIKNDFSIVIAKTKACSVCEPVSQQLERIVSEYDNIPLYAIYADEVEEFRGQYLVFTVPTVLVFSEGKEILRESRFVDFNNIKRLIDLFNQ